MHIQCNYLFYYTSGETPPLPFKGKRVPSPIPPNYLGNAWESGKAVWHLRFKKGENKIYINTLEQEIDEMMPFIIMLFHFVVFKSDMSFYIFSNFQTIFKSIKNWISFI